MLNLNFIKAVDSLELKYPVSQVAKDLSVSKGTVSSYYNGNIKASDPFLEKFANFYKLDLESLKDSKEEKSINPIENIGVPYYDIDFTAGFLPIENNNQVSPNAYVSHPFFKGCDYIVRASGQSIAKVIMPKAIPFWSEILNECTSDDDFLFTRGLRPSLVPTKPYQITKRWKRLVKDKLDVTADFYSLKHLFLDELDKATNSALNLSKEMASHTTNVTETAYLFGRESRKNEVLKKMQLQAF